MSTDLSFPTWPHDAFFMTNRRYGVHLPSVARRDAFYAKLQSERSE